MARSKKGLPKLADEMRVIGTKAKEPQTEGQMKAMLAIIAAQNKLPLLQVTK